MSTVDKWFFVPTLFNVKDCFEQQSAPFSEFNKLRTWRNKLAHYDPGWKQLSEVDSMSLQGGETYGTCNSKNADKTIRIIRDMIIRLSDKTPVPRPVWSDPGPIWLKGLL